MSVVRAVDDPNEGICPLVVVVPVLPDRLLPADVPDVELEAVGLDGLDVEAAGRGRLGRILVTEVLQNRRFAGVVEAEEEDAALVVRAPHLLEEAKEAHCKVNIKRTFSKFNGTNALYFFINSSYDSLQ